MFHCVPRRHSSVVLRNVLGCSSMFKYVLKERCLSVVVRDVSVRYNVFQKGVLLCF